jgi:hypothetical protein
MTTLTHSQIMLYMSAENELSADAQASVDEIKASAPLDGMSTYILLDKKVEGGREDQQGSAYYLLNPGVEATQFEGSKKDLRFNKDMADPRSLKVHLGWAKAHFKKSQSQSLKQKQGFCGCPVESC